MSLKMHVSTVSYIGQIDQSDRAFLQESEEQLDLIIILPVFADSNNLNAKQMYILVAGLKYTVQKTNLLPLVKKQEFCAR